MAALACVAIGAGGGTAQASAGTATFACRFGSQAFTLNGLTDKLHLKDDVACGGGSGTGYVIHAELWCHDASVPWPGGICKAPPTQTALQVEWPVSGGSATDVLDMPADSCAPRHHKYSEGSMHLMNVTWTASPSCAAVKSQRFAYLNLPTTDLLGYPLGSSFCKYDWSAEVWVTEVDGTGSADDLIGAPGTDDAIPATCLSS
jgi:hypothetical protein